MIDKNRIIDSVKNEFDQAIRRRRHIHRYPELSFQEYNTAKYIEDELNSLDIRSKRLANTGVIAVLGQGDKCVGLRADIDALPIHEETGLTFSSENEGVMHACGHDMHTAMLIGAASFLKKNEQHLGGKVKLIFQPGEEKLPGGASIMIEQGLLEDPKVDAMFGQHIYPGEDVGFISIADGTVMGSADELYWRIEGKGTHAAQPHLGNDPILAACQINVALQTLMTKYRDPIKAGVLSITSIKSGFATNVIPESATILGTLRSFDEEWQFKMHNLIETTSTNIAEVYGCKSDLTIKKGYPEVNNHKETTDIVIKTAIELFGSEKVLEFVPKMWGEDFAYYGKKIPSTFWFTGVRRRGQSEMPALHNSRMNPEEEALIYGTSMLVGSALNYLNQ